MPVTHEIQWRQYDCIVRMRVNPVNDIISFTKHLLLLVTSSGQLRHSHWRHAITCHSYPTSNTSTTGVNNRSFAPRWRHNMGASQIYDHRQNNTCLSLLAASPSDVINLSTVSSYLRSRLSTSQVFLISTRFFLTIFGQKPMGAGVLYRRTTQSHLFSTRNLTNNDLYCLHFKHRAQLSNNSGGEKDNR